MIDLNKMFKGIVSIDTIKLAQIGRVSDFDDPDVRGILEHCYSHSEPHMVRLGSVLNACFHGNRRTFLFSRRILDNLVSHDFNSPVNSVNSKTYNLLMHRLLSDRFITKLREPGITRGSKGGIYEITKPDIVDLLRKKVSDEYFQAEKEQCLSFYDGNTAEVTATLSLGELESLTVEEANERFKQARRNRG